MAKGESGRIVVDVDPNLKRRLYSALAMEDSTLKAWFIENAERFLSDKFPNAPQPSSKKSGNKSVAK